jgi:hypothetical protein
MKVYVLSISDVYDYEGFPHTPKVFTDKKKALNALHKEYKEAKQMLKYNGNHWEEDPYRKGKTRFSMYPEGSWGTSHYDGRVDEVEVEE